MKFSLFISVTCLLLLTAPLVGQKGDQAVTDSVTVTFQATVYKMPDSAAVYIAGNHPALGGWHPGKVALQEKSAGVWERDIRFPQNITLAFKFTLGKWENEALSESMTVPPDHQLDLKNDTTFTVVIPNWRDSEDYRREAAGQITGTVHYHRDMQGEGLLPRDVLVWLPPGYADAPEQRYPVIYMHDGQNIVDPNTSFGGVDWQVDEMADSLIDAGEITPVIFVGAYNTGHRSLEYSDTTLGHAYMNFLVNHLKPMIDSTYRTLPGREHTATMGSSMGGLISFLLVWYHPDVFSQAGCLSPAFIYKYHDAVAMVENYQGADKNIRIYMDNGGKDLEAELQPGCDDMLGALKAIGFEEGKNLHWFLDPDAAHTEAAWAARVWRPLKFMFGK